MKRAYDQDRAERLVPLLKAITRELTERGRMIRRLTKQVRILREQDAEAREILDIQAQLATHKRELRLSLKELEDLGCVVDEGSPLAVIIPGNDGNLDHGYRWDSGDVSVVRVEEDPVIG